GRIALSFRRGEELRVVHEAAQSEEALLVVEERVPVRILVEAEPLRLSEEVVEIVRGIGGRGGVGPFVRLPILTRKLARRPRVTRRRAKPDIFVGGGGPVDREESEQRDNEKGGDPRFHCRSNAPRRLPHVRSRREGAPDRVSLP